MSDTPDGLFLDVVAAVGRDIGIADAVTGGEVEMTIEGASTLKLECHDPKGKLLKSKELQKAIDLKYQDTWWRLVKISKSGHSLNLDFEDRDIAHLRQHNKPKKISRGKMTRAQFVHTLVKEVKNPKIQFYSPEINEKQPIAKQEKEAAPGGAPEKKDPKKRDDDRKSGISGSLTVKGAAATAEQKKYGQRVLDVADGLNAPELASVALMAACITESSLSNPHHGMGGTGILQVSSIHSVDPLNIEQSAKGFLTTGYWGKGGAIELANSHKDWPPHQIAQACQGSATSDGSNYAENEKEAKEWVSSYGGTGGGVSGTGSQSYTKRYEFGRGQPGQPETSWDAIVRLAEEVQWRAFMDHGRLYFVSDERLMKSRVRAIVDEDTDGVDSIDFDFDVGKPTTQITVNCRAGLFPAPPGSVIELRDMGVADGRYLISSIRRNLFDPDTTLTLVAPQKKLPEPAAEQGTRASGASGTKGSGKFGGEVKGLKPKLSEFLAELAAETNETIKVISGTRPTDSDSHHVDGSAADLDVGGDAHSDNKAGSKGDAIATAALVVCGIDRKKAHQMAVGGQCNFTNPENFPWRDERIEIGWRTMVGGNHFNHVHVGLEGAPDTPVPGGPLRAGEPGR